MLLVSVCVTLGGWCVLVGSLLLSGVQLEGAVFAGILLVVVCFYEECKGCDHMLLQLSTLGLCLTGGGRRLGLHNRSCRCCSAAEWGTKEHVGRTVFGGGAVWRVPAVVARVVVVVRILSLHVQQSQVVPFVVHQ